MKIKYTLIILAILLSISCYAFFALPPLYINAYFSKYSNSENYENLSSILEKKTNETSYQLSVTGNLLIEGSGVSHTSNEKKKISELMRASNIFLMINKKDLILFHIGSGDSSNMNFRVALAKKNYLLKVMKSNVSILFLKKIRGRAYLISTNTGVFFICGLF